MHRCGKIRFEFRRAVTKRGTREGTGYVPEDSPHGRNRLGFRLSVAALRGWGKTTSLRAPDAFLPPWRRETMLSRRHLRASFHRGPYKVIDEAKRYPEGTPVRIEVHGAEDIAGLKVLAKMLKVLGKIKREN